VRLAVAAALLALPALGAPAAVERASVTTAGGPRAYLIARPTSRAPGPRPLVLVLHGHGGSAEQALGVDGNPSPLAVWREIAERDGLVVAALEGADGRDGKRGWNDCRADAPGNPATDDVAFARAVVARLEREDGVDPSRVYVIGMSNGGFMALRLAIQLDPPPAAVAAVSSSMAADTVCGPPRRPVPVMLVSGTADPIVPYAGGEVRLLGKKRGSSVAIEDAAAAWRRVDRIAGRPTSVGLPHLGGADDPTRAVRTIWGDDPRGLQVELVRVDGGGHIEPSISQPYGRLYQAVVGRQNHDLECAEEAWRFFRDKRAAVPGS